MTSPPIALTTSELLGFVPGKHGPTMRSFVPALDALDYATFLQCRVGVRPSITRHDDGAFTVNGDGCEPITFQDTPLTIIGPAADNED